MTVVAPKSLAGKAFNYLHRQWDRLIRYVENPAVPISNAFAENAIRPFALGRKNWLFSDTTRDVEGSANIYSLLTTAKANGLEPHAYLQNVLTKQPSAEALEDLVKLLPYKIQQA